MEVYLEVLLVIGILAVLVPFVLFFANLFAGAFPIPQSSVFYNTSNTVSHDANNALNYTLVVVLLMVLIIGVVADIYASIKWPSQVAGVMNLFGVFILVALWLVLNNVIAQSNILSAFGYPNSPLYQLFASSYLITAMCAACLVSASFHLSGQEASRQP